MIFTKTKFLEYSRCPKYKFLAKTKDSFFDKDISYEKYLKEEENLKLKELLSSMIDVSTDGTVIDKTIKNDKQLEAMLNYYKDVELEAAKIASKTFKGNVFFAKETKDQKCFDYDYKGIKFLCYTDIYNEVCDAINIIEIKATTSKKYLELESGYPKKKKYKIFQKNNNIYTLREELNEDISKMMPLKNYFNERNKLLDRFGLGNYIYDLAFQRFVIDNYFKEKKQNKKIHYYLGVLNDQYTFDGFYEEEKPVYRTDKFGNEVITFFDCDLLTLEMQPKILADIDILLGEEQQNYPLGVYCGYKKTNECPFFKTVCGNKIPKTNSVLNYVNNGFGFVTPDKKRLKGLDLINNGYYDMLDIDESWITKENHFIQRNCYQNHCQYINKKKIKTALESLEYPIYHLDFETFPCPLPRFKNEHPYTQSPFLFSLHIEKAPGVCDEKKDHVVFLAKTMNDEREDLIKCLLKNVDVNKGTLFAQNVSFEKGRIKELAAAFPKYADDLMKLYNRGFDLLWIINNNKQFYLEKGFNEHDVETFNFYDERLSGSFSIKKTLPLFSDLSYQSLEVKNGTEAVICYANYPVMNKDELKETYKNLKIYCSQDTWAMVLVLNGLRKLV